MGTTTRVVGEVVMRPLTDVKPNGYNPNRMTDFMKESLKQGLTSDGWLKSQALLIWGTDETGSRRDAIIDGEHRWTAATELGFPEGPMVFLDGVTESQAKALTIKMNQKRGEFDPIGLSELVRSIQYDFNDSPMDLSLGLGNDELVQLLMEPALPEEPEAEPTPEPQPAGADPNVQQSLCPTCGRAKP